MRREGVSLLLREDVEKVVVSRRDLAVQIGIGGGEGKGRQVPARTEEEGREGRGEEGGGERGGGEGKERQVVVQRGEENVRTPVDQSMLGLWRCSQGNPSTS